LADSQLLIVEVKPSDHSCHFLFVGPRKPNTLLKFSLFRGIKNPITFLESIVISTAVVKGTIIKTIIKKGTRTIWSRIIVGPKHKTPNLRGATQAPTFKVSGKTQAPLFWVSGARAGTHTFSFFF